MKAKVSPKTVRRSVAQARAFEEAIAKMATDPAIRAECAAISRDFAITEADGLKDD